MLETSIFPPRIVTVVTDKPERLICALVNAGRNDWLDPRLAAMQPLDLLAKYKVWCGSNLMPDGFDERDWRRGIIHPEFLKYLGLDVEIVDCGDRYELEVSRYNDRVEDPEGAEKAIRYFVEDGGWDTRSIARARNSAETEVTDESLRRYALGIGIPTSSLSGAALFGEFAELIDLEMAFLLPVRGTSLTALMFLIGLMMTVAGCVPARYSRAA